MINYVAMDGPTMLRECGQDAVKWAAAFDQIVIQRGLDVDEELMIVWFANSIMNALDIERGTIHNGDHMQYLIDNNLPVPS